jgi:ribonuclease R
MAAERAAFSRYVAAFLANRVGAELPGTISGVARFGLFVGLAETGAEGLVPMARLPYDDYRHDAARHRLVGRASGRVFRLGDAVTVRLVDFDRATASLGFALADHAPSSRPAGAGRNPRKIS